MTIFFRVYGLPVPQGSKVLVGKGAKKILVEGNRSKLMPWRQEVAQLATVEMGNDGPWEDAVGVRLTFILPRPQGHYGTGRNAHVVKDSSPKRPVTKPDLDKLIRSMLDAMTGIVFRDDSQVAILDCAKVYAVVGDSPGAHVEVWSLS